MRARYSLHPWTGPRRPRQHRPACARTNGQAWEPVANPLGNAGLVRRSSRCIAGAVGQVGLGVTPLVTRPPTVTASAMVAEIMQCVASTDIARLTRRLTGDSVRRDVASWSRSGDVRVSYPTLSSNATTRATTQRARHELTLLGAHISTASPQHGESERLRPSTIAVSSPLRRSARRALALRDLGKARHRDPRSPSANMSMSRSLWSAAP